MSIYFCFSDENGAYKRLRGINFHRAHPFYLRSTVMFEAKHWKLLENNFSDLKRRYDLPINSEIKWSFAWSLKSHARSGKKITEKCKFYFLKDYDPERLESFLVDAVALLRNIPNCKAIITITKNEACPRIEEKRLLRMHLQEAMQRIEMELCSSAENLGVLFIDPVSKEKDPILREAYSELYQGGDLIDRYAHIKDSLNFEYSHHSVGIQMADYVAGSFGSMLNNRPLGASIYAETLSHILRKSANGNIGGYGIREVPGNRELRQEFLGVMREARETRAA